MNDQDSVHILDRIYPYALIVLISIILTLCVVLMNQTENTLIRTKKSPFPYTVYSSGIFSTENTINDVGEVIELTDGATQCGPFGLGYCCYISKGAVIDEIEVISSNMIIYSISNHDTSTPGSCPDENFYTLTYFNESYLADAKKKAEGERIKSVILNVVKNGKLSEEE